MSSDGPSLPRACETVRRIAAGELSPVEVIETALRRIEALSPALNALVTLSDTAMDQARDLEARLSSGEEAGPLCAVIRGIQHCRPADQPGVGQRRWPPV